MDIRYTDPDVANLWSLPSTYAQWLHIETLVLMAQRELSIVPADETGPLFGLLTGEGPAIDQRAMTDIALMEERLKHDVVAFLEWLRYPFGLAGRWIHFGLTSSDVVDTAQGMRFKDMKIHLLGALGDLVSELTRWTLDDAPILARTHGQIAEPMTIKARGWHWLTTLSTPAADLSRHTSRAAVCKLSGPVGTYAHNPPEVEQRVAKILGLRPHGPGASQIASRSPLAAWANSAALLVGACAKIAMDIRLMHLTGDAIVPTSYGQVASSSMAHKRNPIQAEQLGGMARLARGYASMLQPLDVWLERDISHSSVERVAVPDLWHTVMHSIRVTTELLRGLTLDEWRITEGFVSAGVDPLVSKLTLDAILEGKDVEQARAWAVGRSLLATPESGIRAMSNYPYNGGVVR